MGSCHEVFGPASQPHDYDEVSPPALPLKPLKGAQSQTKSVIIEVFSYDVISSSHAGSAAAAAALEQNSRDGLHPGTTAVSSGLSKLLLLEQEAPARPATPDILETQQAAAEPHQVVAPWSFGACSIQNGRQHMEDRTLAVDLTGSAAFPHTTRAGLFAVFDGHGGADAAEALASSMLPLLLQEDPVLLRMQPLAALGSAIARAEGSLLSSWSPASGPAAGSTLCMALLLDDTLHLAHVGDSRAVLARGPRGVALTADHKPSSPSEVARISAADLAATITDDGYLYNELGVARGLGSPHIKADHARAAFVATPELASVALDSSTDDFLILATDGLWDALASSDAVAAARRSLAETRDAAAASQALVERAQKLGSLDNTSVVIVLLHGRRIVLPKSNSRLFSSSSRSSSRRSGADVSGGGS